MYVVTTIYGQETKRVGQVATSPLDDEKYTITPWHQWLRDQRSPAGMSDLLVLVATAFTLHSHSPSIALM